MAMQREPSVRSGTKALTDDPGHHFCVIVPAFNRAEQLPRVLDSLLMQTYASWCCWVIDDGSSDDTFAVIRDYEDKDPRFHGMRLEKNVGAVAVNEIGMEIACTQANWWTRLGSDDRFEPDKLALDAAALGNHEAVFGPYVVVDESGTITERRCSPLWRQSARQQTQSPGGLAASWANVAVRTSVLAAVKRRFGNYVDPRLRYTEDVQFNFRVSTVTDWVWRGVVDGQIVVDPDEVTCTARQSGDGIAYDACRTRDRNETSARNDRVRADGQLSCGLIAAELQRDLWTQPGSSSGRRAIEEVEARRLIGELLSTKATCNWNIAEHGDRLGQIWELGGALVDLPGAIAELGVARGGTTRLLSAMFPDKSIYAIDGFQGLADTDPAIDRLPARTFTEIDPDVTKAALRDCSNVVLYEGMFPDVVDDRLRGERFALVHLDTDTYRSIRSGLEFFLPRMSPGGRIFVDDFGWDMAPGVEKATREVLQEWPSVQLQRTTPVQAVLDIP